MDANKLKKLQDIDYTIVPTCGTCVHSFFSNSNSDWGVCVKHYYKHEKHTGDSRKLSINRSGSCGQYTLCENKEYEMLHYREFMK